MIHEIDQKRVIRILVALLLSYIVLTVLVSYFDEFYYGETYTLDDEISVIVYRADGQIDEYDSNFFDLVNKGDTVIVTVPLDKEKEITDSSLCFKVYHSIITVYYEDRILYTYGEEIEEKGRMIGGVSPRVIIPNEAWGKSLQVELKVTEDEAYSNLKNIEIINAQNSLRYYFHGREVEFILMMGLVFYSMLLFLVLIVRIKMNSLIRQGIYSIAFCGILSLWIICYNDMYNVLSGNVRFFAMMEYISLFLVPIPFILYIYEQQNDATLKKILLGVATYFSVFFIVTTILNFTTVNYHYTVFLKFFHISMMCGICIILYCFYRDHQENSLSKKILHYGIYMSIALIAVDVVRFNLDKYVKSKLVVLSISFSQIGVIVFIVSLLVSTGVQFAQSYIGKREKEQLERLVYVDILTGIGNRAGCFRQLGEVSNKKKAKYGIVFYDLNNLKKANDEYGHEMGDKLIRFFANILNETFGEIGYCGRLGGDEFIAIVEGKKIKQIDSMVEKMIARLDFANKNDQFPFEISVAYGIAYSKEGKEQAVEDVLKEADDRMYQRKNYMRRSKECM